MTVLSCEAINTNKDEELNFIPLISYYNTSNNNICVYINFILKNDPKEFYKILYSAAFEYNEYYATSYRKFY